MVMSELFGSMVFNDQVMSARLPKNTYKEFKDCCAHDRPPVSYTHLTLPTIA